MIRFWLAEAPDLASCRRRSRRSSSGPRPARSGAGSSSSRTRRRRPPPARGSRRRRGEQLPPGAAERRTPSCACAGVVDSHGIAGRPRRCGRRLRSPRCGASRRVRAGCPSAVGVPGRHARPQYSSAPGAAGAAAARRPRHRGRRRGPGGSTRIPGRPRPRRPGTRRARGPSPRARRRLDPSGVLAELVAVDVGHVGQLLAPADRARLSVGSPWNLAARSR